LGDGSSAVLVLAFESTEVENLTPHMQFCLTICKSNGGVCDDDIATRQSAEVGSGSGGPAAQWKDSFLHVPYLRENLIARGIIVETFETAVTWDHFESFHKAVLDAVNGAIAKHCGKGKGAVAYRFTHAYRDGVAPYYTVMCPGPFDLSRSVEIWDAIKLAASNAIISNHGTITHHHSVGRDHRDHYEKEVGSVYLNMLAALKDELDPKWILNPGVLIPARYRQRHSKL